MPKQSIFQKMHKKRYRSDRYKNPYFQRKDYTKLKWVLGVIGVLALLIGGCAFFFGSTHFALTKTQINGTETIDPQKLQQVADDYMAEAVFFVFKRSNRFLFEKNTLKQKLSKDYTFERLDVTIEGDVVVVRVREKTSELLWVSDGVPYVVDLTGTVIRQTNETEQKWIENAKNTQELAEKPENVSETPKQTEAEKGSEDTSQENRQKTRIQNLPIFVDVNDKPVQPGDQVMTKVEIENIFRFREHLQTQDIAFHEIQVDRLAGKWMSVMTETGYQIFFDPQSDVDQQAINLETVMRDSVDDPATLQYIDLRFDDHIYVK